MEPEKKPAANGNPVDGRNGRQKWIASLENILEYILKNEEPEQASFLIELIDRLRESGLKIPHTVSTPYVNTIPVDRQPPYPGNREIERRIKSYVRWNAMAMVVKANRLHPDIGGHISTFASTATLYEIAFNHFFRGAGDPSTQAPAMAGGHSLGIPPENRGVESGSLGVPGGLHGRLADMVYFQGHASPGIYSRAYIEWRINAPKLHHFRQELSQVVGLPSYPHPYLAPDFWQFPSVSMGLAPIMSIYQARFSRYLRSRGLLTGEEPRIWCFVGDGEMDEPEASGALSLAGRENLDNLIWVVNCNLQRLDGPVRGNGKIIQELESLFRGAGWNVIKVIWGSDWDPLLAADQKGLLLKRMEEAVDGDYQKYSVEPGSYTRKHFFGKYPELAEMVNHLSDDQIHKLLRGGHDPEKVYAAYKTAVDHRGSPTVILAKTVKGYGLGEAGEGRNVTHQQKKLNERELREFRSRFDIPLADEEVVETPFYRPPLNSAETQYVLERRKLLGGFIPRRRVKATALTPPDASMYVELLKGSGQHAMSTTGAMVRLLSRLLGHDEIGKRIVPIIPDEARTFGMDALFRQVGIYSSKGQLYEPVDRESLLYYNEVKDGQILEEGITEAGAMSSFIAAGAAYANFGINMIPFYFYYSMFGFQRIGDLIWAAADSKAKGFLCGATAGRTTLNGEGLQHQDGHSHILASTIPTLLTYDPGFGYEIAVIVRDGLKRLYAEGEEYFYYLTLYNESYEMPEMPDGAEPGILKGLYRLKVAPKGKQHKAHIFASGPLLREALRAQDILAEQFDVSADVWSATSYKLLRGEALRVKRWNMLHPTALKKSSYLETTLQNEEGVFVAVSDYIKMVPDQIAPWVPGGLMSLGTDGFGRSDTRENLRRYFEVDAEITVVATLYALYQKGSLAGDNVEGAIKKLGVDPEKSFPFYL